ncbi:hypothetical protein M0R72_13885 [Candidatus Pacearchaeota archaeon]|nr:hypothetical protein [Candidatus Pacearchaeota archaeon]
MKIKDMFVEWSTVADAPVSGLMSENDALAYIDQDDSVNKIEKAKRCIRLVETGTTFYNRTAGEMIAWNRAGENETCLSDEEIYQMLLEEAKKLPKSIMASYIGVVSHPRAQALNDITKAIRIDTNLFDSEVICLLNSASEVLTDDK